VQSAATRPIATVSERCDDKSTVVPKVLIGIAEVAVGDANKEIVLARFVRVLFDKISQLYHPIEVLYICDAFQIKLLDCIFVVHEDHDQSL
jgi:hypothetical protein